MKLPRKTGNLLTFLATVLFSRALFHCVSELHELTNLFAKIIHLVSLSNKHSAHNLEQRIT
jgi:hypothetical protein